MLPFVQETILKKLITEASLHYTGLKPEGIDDKLFYYHLVELGKKGYIEKQKNRYSLTNKGKAYIQKFDAAGNQYYPANISVLCFLTSTENEKTILLQQKRVRHPYLGDIGVIAGKVLPGEKPESAAARVLLKETGLKAKFKLVGFKRAVRRTTSGEIIQDTVYHICFSDKHSGKLEKRTTYGTHFWSSFSIALSNCKTNTTSSKEAVAILRFIRKRDFSNLFYGMEDITLETY